MARAPAFFALLLISGLLGASPMAVNLPRRSPQPRRNWPNDRSSATVGAAGNCVKAAGSWSLRTPATTGSVARRRDRRDATRRTRSVSKGGGPMARTRRIRS